MDLWLQNLRRVIKDPVTYCVVNYCSFFPSGGSCLQPTLSSFLLLLEPLSLYALQTSLRIWFSSRRSWLWLHHELHPWSNPIFPNRFLYRQAGQRFLKRSYDLNFSTFCASLVLLTSMPSFCDIYCFKRPTIIFWEGGWNIREKIVCKSKKAKMNCSQTREKENKKFAD